MRGGTARTAAQLAADSGLSQRYLEELLRAAALHGYVACQPVPGVVDKQDGADGLDWDSGIPGSELFTLEAGLEEVLCDENSPHYYAHTLRLPRLLAGTTFTALARALTTDAGVAYSEYGPEFAEFVAGSHAKLYRTELAGWLGRPELAALHTRLATGGSILDLGCGAGWSSISAAIAFPAATVHAVDCDPASIALARQNIREAEAAGTVGQGRVVPHCCLAHEAGTGQVDLVLLLICLHDMHNPSEVLQSARSLLAPGGCLLVLEFTVPDSFPGPEEARPATRFCLSVSVLHCLPVSKERSPSQALGTALSRHTLARLAATAGLKNVTSFPVNETMSLFLLKE